jgi:hypothetical protein
MRVVLTSTSIEGWSLTVLHGAHNHERSADISAHPAHRIAALSSENCDLVKTLSNSGLSMAQIMATIRQEDPEAILTERDISNIIQKARIEQLGGISSIQWLLQPAVALARLSTDS